MSNTTRKTIDRLAGRDLRRIARLRQTAFYRRWSEIADFMEKNPTRRQLLHKIWKLIEDCHGHHYGHIASASRNALDLVCDERSWK